VVELVDNQDYFFKPYPILTQFLRTLRLVPDTRLLKFAIDFFQFFFTAGVVKDTPEANPCAA
jgi:hypothetical protein